ncbi:MAG: hypothetical protein EBZ51_07590 [Synechococcaceae bacterium WB9_2_112]|nr:hypothetical protein [Synechococcaceae bacterium WB9_2_112]
MEAPADNRSNASEPYGGCELLEGRQGCFEAEMQRLSEPTGVVSATGLLPLTWGLALQPAASRRGSVQEGGLQHP